jgi:hypothetical protein
MMFVCGQLLSNRGIEQGSLPGRRRRGRRHLMFLDADGQGGV